MTTSAAISFERTNSQGILERRAQRDKEEAFNAMVEEYSGLAYNVALRMLRKPEDAEDAVQEAFLSAYKSFDRFKGDSKVSTWLYRIVVNVALMKIRKDKTRAKYMAQTGYEDKHVEDWTTDPEKTAENLQLREDIQIGLERLSPDLRAAVVLRDVQEFTSEEASKILGISVSALKSRLHRGRILLRKYLEEAVRAQAGRSISNHSNDSGVSTKFKPASIGLGRYQS